MLRPVSAVPVIVATARDDDARHRRRPRRRRRRLRRQAVQRRPARRPHPGGAAAQQPAPEDGRVLEVGDLVVDVRARTAVLAGRTLDLRPREFDLLAYLAARPGEVVTKRDPAGRRLAVAVRRGGQDRRRAPVLAAPQAGRDGRRAADAALACAASASSWSRRRTEAHRCDAGSRCSSPRRPRWCCSPSPLPLAVLIDRAATSAAITTATDRSQRIVPAVAVGLARPRSAAVAIGGRPRTTSCGVRLPSGDVDRAAVPHARTAGRTRAARDGGHGPSTTDGSILDQPVRAPGRYGGRSAP